MRNGIVAVTIGLALIGAPASLLSGQQPAPPQPAPPVSQPASGGSVRDGVFTAAQAKRGAMVYLRECSVCHGDTLGGGEGTPALIGAEFFAKWNHQTVGDLFEKITVSMPPPPDQPGRLTRQQYADVLAYVLSVHKFPDGKTELSTEIAQLKRIRLEAAKKP